MNNNAKNQESPRTIWGKVLQKLKDMRLYDLHALCVNLDNVSIYNNTFCITVYQQNVYDKLQNNSNLVASFEAVGYNYSIRIIMGETTQDKLNKKLSSIEEMLGYNIKIKLGD